MAEDDKLEIERLVRWIAGDFEYGEEVALDRDPDAMRRLREIAADAHRRWDADRTAEVKITLTNVHIDGDTYEYEIELDGDDLDGIFDGTDEPEDVRALRAERAKTAEQIARDRAATNERERKESQRVDRENNTLFFKVVAFCAAVVSAVVAIGILEKHEHHETKKEDPSIKAGHAGDKVTGDPTAAPDPAPDPIVDAPGPAGAVVRSCTCNTDRDRFTLMAPTESNGASQWYFVHQSLLFPISAGDAGVPPASTSALRAAMACDGDVVALVSGSSAAAWSIDGSAEPRWTRKLPAAIANAPQSIGCSDALPVRDGRVTLPLANGQRVSLSMRDGKLD